MAKKGAGGDTQASQDLSRIAQQLFSETQPLRSAVTSQAGQVFGVPAGANQAPTFNIPQGATVVGDQVFMPSMNAGLPLTPRQMAGEGGGGGEVAVRPRSAPVNLGPLDQFRAPNPVVGGETDVLGASLPAPILDAIKTATGQQFANARENIIANTPAGGALTGALTNLEGARATSLSQSIGEQLAQERAAARAIAFGAPQTAVSGLSGAGDIQAQLALAQAQQSAGKSGALGSGLGAAAGLKAVGKAGGSS